MKKHQIIIFLLIITTSSHSQIIPSDANKIKTELVENRNVMLIKIINNFFNREIFFSTDMSIWGQVDYWASPLELLTKGAGDCEDYAIAKFFYLIKAGVSVEKLRIVYVRVQIGEISQAHMVVAYFKTPSSPALILDNLITEIRPLEHRPDLQVVYSFNQVDIWKELGNENVGSAIKRLSKWREVLEKIKVEEKIKFDTFSENI